jgi:hypothetical protein
MNELGLLWQSDTNNSAHEHFISYLIKQNIGQYRETSSVEAN